MSRLHRLGPLHYQIDWDSQGWYYVNQKSETVNMGFFMGSVVSADHDYTLYQFILGPFMLTWAWSA